jgi:hypothetical protein
MSIRVKDEFDAYLARRIKSFRSIPSLSQAFIPGGNRVLCHPHDCTS